MSAPRPLTPKQQRFVDEYLIDLNASAAALRAGYSPRRNSEIGWQLLQKTTVQAAIQSRMDERAKRTAINQDYVLGEIKAVYDNAIRVMDDDMVDRKSALKALEMMAKHVGLFEKDNTQKGDGLLAAALAAIDRMRREK